MVELACCWYKSPMKWQVHFGCEVQGHREIKTWWHPERKPCLSNFQLVLNHFSHQVQNMALHGKLVTWKEHWWTLGGMSAQGANIILTEWESQIGKYLAKNLTTQHNKVILSKMAERQNIIMSFCLAQPSLLCSYHWICGLKYCTTTIITAAKTTSLHL